MKRVRMIDKPGKLLSGLSIGGLFGLLLQKGRVAKSDVIVQQLLWKDWTVLKVMSTAVAVGSAGVFAMERRKMTRLSIKPLNVGGVTLGGTIFGAGMALSGYCPGTTLAAVGEGHKDAIYGVLGMLAGAGAFVLAYPKLKPLIEAGSYGKVTLPELTKSARWPWVMGFGAAVLAGSALRESYEARSATRWLLR